VYSKVKIQALQVVRVLLYCLSVFVVSVLTFGYSNFNTKAEYTYSSKFDNCINQFGSAKNQLVKFREEKKKNPSLMLSSYAEDCYQKNGCLNPCGSLCDYAVKDEYSYQEYLLYLTSLPFTQIDSVCVDTCIEICMLSPDKR